MPPPESIAPSADRAPVDRCDADTFGLGHRLDALVREIGGWRTLPTVQPTDLLTVAEITHPRWLDPRGLYEPERHEKMTALIRKTAVAPLQLVPAKTAPMRINRNHRIFDHGKRLLDMRDHPSGAWPMAWWQSPYMDAQGWTPDADRERDGLDYAARITAGLNASGLLGIVIGHGSYHPAAVDLLVWGKEDTKHIRARFEEAPADALPGFTVAPWWF